MGLDKASLGSSALKLAWIKFDEVRPNELTPGVNDCVKSNLGSPTSEISRGGVKVPVASSVLGTRLD
jgi:hypothetical protein